ncbi:actin-like ATPase domain-containing protein [Wallemia mellicola]|nr:actin-like ATPase domain-containing protein [Wallemia mellicola]
MPDWAKLADKGKEYSNKGIDKGKKAYQNSRSAPTNKASPFEPPKQIVSLDHQPARNTAPKIDFAPPPLRPDSARSSSTNPGIGGSSNNQTRGLPPRGSAPPQPGFRGRASAQVNPRLPMREDLPQYPGQPSNIFKENKEQFFSFLDDYFAKNPPRQSDEPKGYADCIANEDGQRQIASALAFNGEEEYVGNQAKPQLVRNNKNTILGFRNLLGREYSQDIPQSELSANVINNNGTPSYKVTINGKEEILSVKDVTVKVLQSLANSAIEYVGKAIDGAVMSVPHNWSREKRQALKDAAKEANIPVLDLIDDWAAGMSAYNEVLGESDVNVLVVDMGEYSTSVTTVAARQGLFTPLSNLTDDKVGGQQLDKALVTHFAKEFTKQTKLNVPTEFKNDLEESDRRALVKLTLACEQTKRSLTASNSAGIAIESLKDGIDFSSQVNRLRFGILASKTFNAVGSLAEKAVKEASLEIENIDKIVLIGGSSSLPSLTNVLGGIFTNAEILSSVDPDQAIAKGSAIQAKLLFQPDVPKLPSATTQLDVGVTSAPIILAGEGEENAVVVAQNTPLPARRIVSLNPPKGDKAFIDLYEGKHEIKVVQPPPREKSAEDEEFSDEEDDEPERIPIITRTSKIASLQVPIKNTNPITLQLIVLENASVEIRAEQQGQEPVAASVNAP